MVIRDATRGDVPAWAAMRTALWPDSSDAHRAELEAFFAGRSIDIETACIAEVDGTAIGFLELNIRDFAEGSRSPKVPYVEAWYVAPGHRDLGYGARLMRYAEDWAVSMGYSELASDTDLDNERSIAMHRQLGFAETARVVCFLKTLTGA